MYSIRHINLVRALAEHRHFGHAASALGVSQPALTRSLKQLEQQLGVPIFDRDGVSPTLFGRIILDHGERIIAAFNEMMREIALAKGLDIGELHVAAGPYAADISVQRAIGMLSTRHPGLNVRLRIVDWTEATEAVLAGKADLAVAEIAEARTHPELEVEAISSAAMQFYCGRAHPLAAQAAPTLATLLAFPWVGPTTPGRIGAAIPQIEGVFGSFDRRRDRFIPRITVETFGAARDIVSAGLGIGAAAPFQISREVREGELVLLPFELPWLTLNYGFITRRSRVRSPAAAAFMALVREIEAERGAG